MGTCALVPTLLVQSPALKERPVMSPASAKVAHSLAVICLGLAGRGLALALVGGVLALGLWAFWQA
jgi:hypothetical protein